MERPTFYQRAETVPIKARNVPALDPAQVAPECLFVDDQIPAFHVVGRKNGHAPVAPNSSEVGLYTISEVHGRSYELTIPGMSGVGAWADEHGILFSSFSIKGNNVDDPHVWPSPIMPEKFATQGLQDSSFIRRTILASQVLRSIGVEAEMTTRVIEPLTLPVDGKEMTIDQFKDEVLRRTLLREGIGKSLSSQLNLKDRKKSGQMRKFIENADYRFSVRAMQAPERLSDLPKFETRDEALAVLGRAFDFINFSERLKSEENPEYEADFFDVNNQEDILRYFGTYLPTKVGRYFATMHRSGLVHGFPHPGNISTVGSIYDLDSVKGEKLGLGDKLSWTDYDNDLRQLFLYDSEFFANQSFLDLIGIDVEKVTDLKKISKNNLLRAYLESFDTDVNNDLSHALEIFLKLALVNDKYSETTLKWIMQIVELYGIEFTDVDDNYEQMLDAYEKYFSKHPSSGPVVGLNDLAVFATVLGSYFVEDKQYDTEFSKVLATVRCVAPLLEAASKDTDRISLINERIRKKGRIKKAMKLGR